MTLPAIAQLVEHLTVDHCSKLMVPGSVPDGRMYIHIRIGEIVSLCIWSIKLRRAWFVCRGYAATDAAVGMLENTLAAGTTL